MSVESDAVLRRLRTDFEFYAPRCLKILTKAGKLVPFALNRAQLYIHTRLEAQLARTGRVRAIILKGRQQGASTYVGGRFYWRSSGQRGKRVQILTHEATATDNLFRMTKRYHDNCPLVVRPSTSNSSAKELVFNKLDTRYAISTAGSEGTGRSSTAQFFHGSEVAFWPNAQSHMAGLGQAVPDEPGTEIILESTADGIGNLFHGKCMEAMRGRGDYELIFVPWHWEDGYCKAVLPASFDLSDDERAYQDAYGLSDGQMAWRQAKTINDFGGDYAIFNQEYPASIEMAFMASASSSLISPIDVANARKRLKVQGVGPLVMTLDPAEYGDDDSVIARRRGRLCYPMRAWSKRGPMELSGLLAAEIDKHEPDAVCIDVTGGYGRGILERLAEQGYKNLHPISFGAKALDEKVYANRRAEMYGLLRDWMADEEPQLPDDDVLASELASVTHRYDSSRRMLLTSKEQMRSDGIPSPDRADALAMTFAVRMAPSARIDKQNWRERLKSRPGGGSPMTA